MIPVVKLGTHLNMHIYKQTGRRTHTGRSPFCLPALDLTDASVSFQQSQFKQPL